MTAPEPYYDDLWFMVEEFGEPDIFYHTKAGVTRCLRERGLRFQEDGFPIQWVRFYDRHPEEDDGVYMMSMPAPLWMQFIAGKQQVVTHGTETLYADE